MLNANLNGKVRRILMGNECQVLASAIVDLITRVQRPYLWRVTVTGLPPHNVTRVYEIQAKDDNTAAHLGIDIFVKAMQSPGLTFILDAGHA